MLAYSLVTFLCILGAAAGFFLLWAGIRFFYNNEERDPHNMSTEQAVYVRDVKMRNMRDMALIMGRRDIARQLSDTLSIDEESQPYKAHSDGHGS